MAPDWRAFHGTPIHKRLLYGHSLLYLLQWVFANKLVKLKGCVLLKELVNQNKTASNFDGNFIALDSD